MILELLIGIYEGFIKVICSLLLAEKSYSHLKIEKIEKKVKNVSGEIRTTNLQITRLTLYHRPIEFVITGDGI